MIENSMFYMNFEASSDNQKRCVEEIKRIGLDDIMNPIYLLANAIIKRTNLHKSLFDMAEEIMDEIGVTNKENRKIIHEITKVMFNKEVDRDKLEEFIQTNCSMMEQ